MAQEIWASGNVAICPHLNTLYMDDPCIPDDTFYDGDEVLIRRCVDAMVMLPGWDHSKGSLAERQLAYNTNIPVFYHDWIDQLWAWLKREEV